MGRTGAGKSSLTSAIFRLAEPTGDILLKGVPTAKMGLHKLRRSMSIIPQDPLLFKGALRKNLDPFEEYEDTKIWEALKQVGILHCTRYVDKCVFIQVNVADMIALKQSGLEAEVEEGGANLSVGERQLICFARAVLKKNDILILDEATANVDLRLERAMIQTIAYNYDIGHIIPHRTDTLIQEVLRTAFSHCTILTIAHRLHTVMDADKIMVMVDGELKVL